jgi:hypothetical protein
VGVPEGYVLDFNAIERLMKAHQPRLNWSSLATKAEIDPKSLRRWRDGAGATAQKVEDLARALKTTPEVIAIGWMASEDIMNAGQDGVTAITGGISMLTPVRKPGTIKIDAHALDQEELDAILKVIAILLKREQAITLDGTREGCVELLVKLTDEEIRTLQEAIKAGKLTHLRVIDVKAIAPPIEGTSPPTPPAPPLSPRRLLLSAKLLAAAAVCLSLTGVAPVYALPWYFVGLVLAAASLYFSYAAGSRLVLPIVSLLMNLIAIICWPNVVGFFDGPGGHSFTVGSRANVSEPNSKNGLKASFVIAPLLPPSEWENGEYIELLIDGKTIVRCWPLGERMAAKLLDANGAPLVQPAFGRISFGARVITVTVNGKTVFSKQITIEPCDPDSATIQIEVRRDGARVTQANKGGHFDY